MDKPHIHRCYGCGSDDALHMYLIIRKRAEKTTRSVGAIDLCQACWREATGAAAIRRRPKYRKVAAA